MVQYLHFRILKFPLTIEGFNNANDISQDGDIVALRTYPNLTNARPLIREAEQRNLAEKNTEEIMWVKQCHKPSPNHHHK